MFHGPGVAVVALVPVAGPVPPPSRVVTPLAIASSTCCGQIMWMWRVDPAGGDDHPLAGDDVRAGADDQARIDPVEDVRITRLADPGDPPVLDADIGLDHPPVIDDQGVGDDEIERVVVAGRLPHPIPDDLATAEGDLVAVDGEVPFDLDDRSPYRPGHPARQSGNHRDRRTGGVGSGASLRTSCRTEERERRRV